MGGGTTPARVPPQGARAGPTTRCVGGHGREGPGDQRGRPTPVVAQEDIHAGREEGVARGAGGTAAARRDNRRLESEIEILKRARSACFTRGNVAPQKGAPAGPIASRPRCRRRHDLPGPESGGCRATPRGASAHRRAGPRDAHLANPIVDIHAITRCSHRAPRVHAELRLGCASTCPHARQQAAESRWQARNPSSPQAAPRTGSGGPRRSRATPTVADAPDRPSAPTAPSTRHGPGGSTGTSMVRPPGSVGGRPAAHAVHRAACDSD